MQRPVASVMSLWAAVTTVLSGCPAPQQPAKLPVARAPAPIIQKTGRPEVEMTGDVRGEIAIEPVSAGAQATTGVTITDLPPAETAALIARLEPLPGTGASDVPVIRPPSAMPPGPGNVQAISFAAPSGASVANHAANHGPPVATILEAPQILPVGEVAMESEVRVRFAEPMVAVDKLGPAPALATFEPAIAGTWKWSDTRVAVFTAKAARLAQATEYKVTVRPGIKAVSGAVLDQPTTGAFSTPPVSIVSTFPSGPQRADAPIAIQFSQDIDEKAVLPFLRVLDGKNKPVPFVLGNLARARTEWAKNPRNLAERDGLGDRYVLIAPVARWPAGTNLTVRLEKNAPSHEGPRLSRAESLRTFTVAPTFRATGIDCDDEKPQLSTTCPALSTVNVAFTTPLDAKQFRADMVAVAGKTNVDHTARGNTVSVLIPNGEGKTFKIDLRNDLRDAYGQELEGTHQLSVTASRFIYQPELQAATGLYVLDPRYQVPQYVIETQAVKTLHVDVYKVQPSDYFAYQSFEEGKTKTPPGKRISATDFSVGDRYAATERLDLRPALAASGTGHVVVVTRATLAPGQKKRSWLPTQTAAWVQVTKLGVITRVDDEQIHAWVDDISHAHFLDARPNAVTSLVIQNRPEITTTATTDANGEVTLALPAALPPPKLTTIAPPPQLALVVARDRDDSVFTALDRSARTERVRNAEWYVTDDRFTYKPDEPVYMKGWVRWTHSGVNPGLEMPGTGDRVSYEVIDARQNKLASGTAAFTDRGGFDFQFDLPKNTNLGYATVLLHTKDQDYAHRINVQEFRTPAYSVNLNDDVQASGVAPLFLGDALELNAEAKYYAGGGLGGAAVKWDAMLQNASYKPPGWERYSFDPVKPRHRRYDRAWIDPVTATAATTLGGGSNSLVRLALHALPAGEPAVLTVDSTVTDVDRQTIRASSRKILVHPASYYVGMRLMPDTRDQVQVIVTDLDGKAVAGVAVEVKLEATLYSESSVPDAVIRDSQRCSLKSAREPVVCTFKPSANAELYYRAIAVIHDARGRANQAQYFVPYWRSSESTEALSITADRPKYAVGETAKLMIHSSELPATAMVSFSRQGVIEQHRIELRHAAEPFEVKMDVSYLENLYVEVDRIAKRQTDDQVSPDPLPAHMEASVNLEIDLDASRLQINARAQKPLVQPGDNATFEVDVARNGKPVANAEVALIVVDEAVLALSGMHHDDPMNPFYRSVEAGTAQANSFDTVADEDEHLLGVPGFTRVNLDENGYRTLGHGSGSGAGYGFGSGHGAMAGQVGSTTVSARKDFRATAVFAPHLHTDAKGHATISVKMPESLTRFRVVALASSETYFFGKGEGTIVTQRKVNARTQAPRFLDQGDRFDVPVVVQNLDSTARTIDVAVRAANLSGGGGKRVVVPAGQRAEVRFPFATMARGKAVIQTIVSSGAFTDASNVAIPVYVPATTETFATYGTIDKTAAYEQLDVPADIFADVGGVETEVASTQLQTLTDAYWYLRGYPFECAEQRSSRMLATSAMANVLDAFALPDRPGPQEQAEIQAADVHKLEADQNSDGGWGYWRDTKSDPFVTMQVATALSGLGATKAVQKNAAGYIAKILKDATARLAKAHHLDPVQVDVSLAATALTALAATGLDEKAAAQRLHDVATKLAVYPVDAKARLLAIVAKAPAAKAMRAKLVSELVSVTHETAAGATVTATYTEGERLLLVSNNRTTALALDALIRETPDQPLIMKLARGLLAARAHGRWRSTQENLAVLQAMSRYFAVYEKDVPSYTGKLWIGDVAYAEQAFQGRSNLRASAKLDWTKLVPGSQHAIAVEKTGSGRMYYRIGITYAPKQIDLPALDSGFVVRRSYEAVDHPDDVVKTGTGYRIKLGARVLVTVEALNTTRRDGVALVDPLPAGLEAVNTSLAVAERAAKGAISRDWDHLETRDDRTEAFAGTLNEGSHVLSYTARATTPGTFNAAPAKAEEMYSPETFGRSQGAIVVVY